MNFIGTMLNSVTPHGFEQLGFSVFLTGSGIDLPIVKRHLGFGPFRSFSGRAFCFWGGRREILGKDGPARVAGKDVTNVDALNARNRKVSFLEPGRVAVEAATRRAAKFWRRVASRGVREASTL